MPLLPGQERFIHRDVNIHALLVAGPGTGKTWTLERRSEYLIANGVPEDALGVLTLTRSMAKSLSARIPFERAGTLHSFALRQLNRLGDAWGKKVVDPWEVRTFVRTDLQIGYESSFDHSPGRGSPGVGCVLP